MIYKFEQYKNFNKKTFDFIDDKITESEFIEYLNNEIANENILSSVKDFFGGFKQKVIDIFWSFLVKSYQVGFSIFDKVNTFVKWLFDKINSFSKKHPTLWKIMIITIVILIILMVTAASAKAQTSGTPIPKAKLDMAIGWLDYLKTTGKGDTLEVNKAIAHLVDMRDGKIDIIGLGQKAVDLSQAALNTAQKVMDDAKTSTDNNLFKMCNDLIQKGSEYINVIYSKADGFENVKLFMK